MNCKMVNFFLVSLFFLLSCGVKHITAEDYIKNTDSASISFYDKGDSATQIILRDKASIEKLGNYIDGRGIEPQKCANNGSIWFYKSGKKKMQVDFSLNDGCTFFSYMMNDKLFSKSMSEDANKFLNSVKDIASVSL